MSPRICFWRVRFFAGIFISIRFGSIKFSSKQDGQLFYYESSPHCILLKIPEPLNLAIFQSSSKLLLLETPQETNDVQGQQQRN